ncbi:LANO_0D10528g1_1 [Lachancea nothofagi CBS 11611]|uniref:LANO_0D10528g1_1 n=1 Tax=Lachancea nothofagi CBS 11611 TaxID=1266666 RepID=A0A1G4JKD6_9SACH|nr:LANO_0D10528g1_1 [Lachancea nothofagi CBS 11611]
MDGARTSLLLNLRCWRSGCHRRQIGSMATTLPKEIQRIVGEPQQQSPLQVQELNAVLTFMRKGRNLTIKQRASIIQGLYRRDAHREVVTVAKSALFDGDQNYRENVSAVELKKFFSSLISMGRTMQLAEKMFQMIKQFSLTRNTMVMSVINATFVQTSTQYDVPETLLVWIKLYKYLEGHADFTNYEIDKPVLKTLLFYLRSKKLDLSTIQETLELIGGTQGPLMASQFASTLIYLTSYNRDFDLTEGLWNYKIEKKYPIISSDLTQICKAYCHFEKFRLVQQTHSQHPEAHDDNSQFDYLLIAYAKQQDWQSLQNQFNALFGIGELPNINHYGIVMFSVARLGEKEMVEKLYHQLLRRKMIPTLPVLQALLQAYYKIGDFNGCFQHFELFNKYDIKPTPSTCQIMLQVYRNLCDVDGSLKFLKKMTDSNVEMSERHFSTIINTCAKTTNHAIAEQLFQVMKSYYNIIPTGASVAALAHVYIESNMPQLALKLFKEYCNCKPPLENEIAIYNKAAEAYMRMGLNDMSEKIFEEVLGKNLPANSEFYTVMIKHLSLYMKDYSTAENVLDQLLNHPKLKASPSHFEALMKAYDRVSNRDAVLKLYQKILDNNVPVNSKILYYLIKATFKMRLRSKENLDDAIDLVDDIMNRAANRTLDITFEKLHPSVMAWPMRAAAKFHSPMRAIELMNKYNDLFFEKTESTASNLVVMRSLLVLSAEVHQWDDFQKIYERYMTKISFYQNLPSAIVRNKRLDSLLIGILSYKIKHLVASDRVTEVSKLLKDTSEKNLVIDNDAWNEAILSMFADTRTIEDGIQLVDSKLIHGFNVTHKYRLLRKHAAANTSTDRNSWFLEKKRQNPNSFQPKLYLKSSVFDRVTEAMDNYLNTQSDLETELTRLTTHYKYFMKSYLMSPRNKISEWADIETRHAPYLQKIRSGKRAINTGEVPF